MHTNRLIFNILSQDLEASARFYEQIAGLVRIYDSHWYKVLSPSAAQGYELGLIDAVHEVVPKAARGVINGGYLTLVVDDLEAALVAARALDAHILELPLETDYGQRRMLLRDPNGVVVDVSQPLE